MSFFRHPLMKLAVVQIWFERIRKNQERIRKRM